MNEEYNIIGRIGNISIKWHPTYKFSLWYWDRCLEDRMETLTDAISVIVEDYPDEIHDYEDIPLF